MVTGSIAVLCGDGIGREIMDEGLKVLGAIQEKYGHNFGIVHGAIGGEAYAKTGHPYPDVTRDMSMASDAVLKGPLGLSLEEMAKIPPELSFERAALLPHRKDLGVYACYRPIVLTKQFASFSPLKERVIGDGIDILMIREMLGGNYFGDKVDGEETGMQYAVDVGKYIREQVERIAHVAFREARKRGCQLTNVNKPNVMATGRFWNAIVDEIRGEYLDVPFRGHVIVDNMAFQLMVNPTQYNGVVLFENQQGDILTDQGGGALGSLGLMPSAILNPETGKGIYEPSHGSAPDIAGQGIANPYSMIGSVALMLEHSFGLVEEPCAVWDALTDVFGEGYRTRDLTRFSSERVPQDMILLTEQFGNRVRDKILAI
jgi:3-isopropylmalate dehydrogenase